MPIVGWEVRYNGLPINKPHKWVNASFDSSQFYVSQKLHDYLWDDFRHAVGRPDKEIAFMDFEAYTTESLMGDHDYFANIYLTIMTHMKARGLVMPPILGKNVRIHALMEQGDVQGVEMVMNAFIGLEGAYLDDRCRSHMEYEAREILETARWERDAKDPRVPLENSFPRLDITYLDGIAEKFHRAYTIIAVENDLHNPGNFEQMVIRSLEQDGRWKGTRLITEVNLSACMHYCATNKIDLILFDWRNPSGEEVMQVGSTGTNSIYQAFYGNSLATLNAENGQVTLSDGRTLGQEDLDREAERLDIRNKWMDTIVEFCRRKGVIPPPYYIIRDGRDEKELADIVARKLNR